MFFIALISPCSSLVTVSGKYPRSCFGHDFKHDMMIIRFDEKSIQSVLIQEFEKFRPGREKGGRPPFFENTGIP